MAEEPPPKRICKIMEEIDWREWTHETKAKRVKILQHILAAPSATNDQRLACVKQRMENFRAEDATIKKLRDLWEYNMPASGTAEESASLLEVSTLLLELFLMRSVVYADEANDLENFLLPR
jgi:hypothetical protein